MAENRVKKLNDLYLQFGDGQIDRRELMQRAGTLGLSAAALATFARSIPVGAQDATPAATFEPFKSATFADYKAQLNEDFPFTADPGAQNQGGIVIYGEISSSNITTVNPLLQNNSPTSDLNALCFEYLYGTNPVDGQYVPNLAEHWEIADDGKTYTFYLQQNVTWHDGTPFTADDVIFSFDSQINETIGTAYRASFMDAVASYRKIDDHTVEVVATDVLAQIVFLGNALTVIIPKHIWESVPADQWRTDGGATGADPSRVVGTGPFKFQEINEGEGTTTWVKNESYWDSAPVIDNFIFQVWPDETAAVEALRAGQIDFFQDIPPTDVESLTADENLTVAVYETYRFRWYGMNLDPERTLMFQDRRVRQALFYGLDRETLVNDIQLGYAVAANGTQPTLSPAYAPDQASVVYNYDPEKAQSLLEEAGWTDSDGDGIREYNGAGGEEFPTPEVGTKLSFDFMFGSGSGALERLAAAMQDYWKAIGVDAQPTPVDFDTVIAPALQQTFDFRMVMLGFSWDPTADQKAMFGTEYKGDGYNAMSYSNPEYDRLSALSDREVDPEKRKQILIQASDIVNTDLPVGIIWFTQEITAYNKRLQNFTPNAQGGLLWTIPYVWIQE